MPGQVPARYVSTTLRSPRSPALIEMLPGRPARRTTSHSLMPSAIPPMIWGPPGCCGRSGSGLTETGVAAGIGARARSPAMEPTGRSAGGAGAAAGAEGAAACGGAAGAVGALQRPSALTNSSEETGPHGLSWAFLSSMTEAVAQLGLANTSIGLENQP